MVEARFTGNQTFLRNLNRTPDLATEATRMGLNRALKGTKTLASAAVRTEVNLKKRYVDDKLHETPATNSRLVALLSAESRGILLTRFPHKAVVRRSKKAKYGGRQGYRVTVKKSQPKHLRGAFLVNLKGGNQGLAIRTGKGRNFEVLHGPSVSQVYSNIRSKIEPQVRARLQKEINQALRHKLRTLVQ